VSKRSWAIAFIFCVAACVPKKPPAPPSPPAPPPIPLDTKAAWTLRLEHQRMLRDAGAAADAAAAAPIGPRALASATTADLEALALDTEPAIRRRALLAIGRVGLPEGTRMLVPALADPDDTVRATAAFALGLLGTKEALDPLQAALKDASPVVRGRAAESLGLIGDRAASPAVAEAAGCRTTIAALEPDDEEWPKTPEVELCRLSLFALATSRRSPVPRSTIRGSRSHGGGPWRTRCSASATRARRVRSWRSHRAPACTRRHSRSAGWPASRIAASCRLRKPSPRGQTPTSGFERPRSAPSARSAKPRPCSR
jgi:hypothetical protein